MTDSPGNEIKTNTKHKPGDKETPDDKDKARPGQDLPPAGKPGTPVALDTTFAVRETQPLDPKKESQDLAELRRIGRQYAQDVAATALTWLTTCTITNDGLAGKTGEPSDGKPKPEKTEKPEKKEEAPKAGQLSQLPFAQPVKNIIETLLPRINAQITKENEDAANPKPLLDQKKLEAEWAEGKFGPESAKAWKASCDFLNKEVINGLKALDARGFPLTSGLPVILAKDGSGSGRTESPQLFRERLRAGQVQLKLGEKELAPGELPGQQEIVRYINAKATLERAEKILSSEAKIGQARFLSQDLRTLKLADKPLTEWRKLQGGGADGATIDDVIERADKDLREAVAVGDDEKLSRVVDLVDKIQDWSSASTAWRDPAVAVEHYASIIASLNAATRTDGTDWPSVARLRHLLAGHIPADMGTFSDEALQPGVFPGTVVRNTDHTLKSATVNMPENLDRNNIDNLKTVEAQLKWLAKYAPAVDRLLDEVADDKSKDGSGALSYAEISGSAPDQDLHAPEKDKYNAYVVGFTAQPCRQDGTLDENGDFYKINSYKEYRYNHWYAFYEADYLGSVERVKRVSLDSPTGANGSPGMIIGKNDSVRVLDGERIKLVQGRHLPEWLAIKQEEYSNGRTLNVFIDVGFAATGLSEAKAARTALTLGEVGSEFEFASMRALAYKKIAHATWSGGLAATGVFRQAISNNVPGGDAFLWARDKAVDIDMTSQLIPSKYAWQPRLGNWLFGETELAAKALKKADSSSSLFGKTVDAVHALYTGGESKAGRWLSGFAWVDYSMYYEHGAGSLNFIDKRSREKTNSSLQQRLEKTSSERGESYQPADQTFHVDLNKPEKNRPDSARPVLYGAFGQYSQYLAPDGQPSEPLMTRAEQIFSSGADADKEKLLADAAITFVTGDDKAKTAAAILCLSMRKEDNLHEQFSTARDANAGRMIEYLKEQTLQSPDPHVRLAAADALMRISNQFVGAHLPAEAKARQINAKYMQLQSQRMAQLTSSLDRLKTARTEEKRERRAGPATMAASRPATGSNPAEEQRLAALDKQIAEQREKLERATKKLDEISQFYSAGKVDYTDMATVCLGVLNDPKATRQEQLDALITKTGLRLDLIIDSIKNEVEPTVHRMAESQTSLQERANLYGRDSQILEAGLRQVVANGKTDPDVRALCMQILAANAPATLTLEVKNKDGTSGNPPLKIGTQAILGRNLEGQGVQTNHAQVRISSGGDIEISPMKDEKGVVAETWIMHADGQKEKLSYAWKQLQDSDQVILGDKDKGAILQLGDDRWQRFADLRKLADQLKTPGGFSTSFSQQMALQLQFPLSSKDSISPMAVAAQWDKYSAAQAAIASGFDTLSNENREMVANALAQCIESNLPNLSAQPDLAIRAMSLLSDDLVKSLKPEQKSALQEHCLAILSNAKNSVAINNLKTLTLEHLPTIFAGANADTLAKATTMLDCLLINGKTQSLRSKNPELALPPFPGNYFPLRVAALQALSKIAPLRASEVSAALLAGGKVDNLPVQVAGLPVRTAALGVLEQAQPENLHALVAKALHTETDAALIARLYNVEYKNRPADQDSVRELQELQSIRHRLVSRMDLDSLKKGKEVIDSYVRSRTSVVPRLYDQAQGTHYTVNDDFYHPEAKKARLGLLYMASQDSVIAGAHLARMCADKGPALAEELRAPLEVALQSNPQMSNQARLQLVETYMNLRSSESDHLAQEEKALVLLSVLQNSIRNMPRTPYNNPAEYNSSLELQTKILAKLGSLPMDKMVPVLASLAQGSGSKQMDNYDRPTTVQYGTDIVRNFSYVPNSPADDELRIPGNKTVQSFVEQKPGQPERTFKFIGNRTWQNENGEKIFDVSVVTDSGRTNFDDRLGDLSYRDTKGVSHIFRTNGSHIETRRALDGNNVANVVKITYPGGKTSREFVLSGDKSSLEMNSQTMKVTDSGTGKTETWTGVGDNFHTADGKMAAHTGNLPGFPIFLTLHPLQMERGDFTYVQNGVQHVFDSSGAEYKTEHGVTVLVKQPDLLASEGLAHPMQNVRAYAATALARMNKSDRADDAALLNPGWQPVQGDAASIDYQRAYENIEQMVVHGQEQARLDGWGDHWRDICERNNFNLLYPDGFEKAQENAATIAEQQRGSLTRWLSGEDKQLQAQARRDVADPLWKQYDRFLDLAKTLDDSTPTGRELRQAVVGNIFYDCKSVPQDPQRAMSSSIDALCSMSEPGQGDFAWAMAACLTEKPNLSYDDQSKLIDALANQIVPKGNLSLADAADIMRISLEQSFRTMPGLDKAKERRQSLALQEKKLARLQEWGNVNHLPFLTTLAQEHNDPVIKDKAAQARVEILRRAKLAAQPN